MAGVIAILVLSFLSAAALWLCLGSRFRFTPSQAENDLANFLKKNLIKDEIVIGMGAGSISSWMRGLEKHL